MAGTGERVVVAVIGHPASGKTSVMRAFLRQYHPWYEVRLGKGVMAVRCETARLTVLGRYHAGDIHAGTDRLSMSAQPEVLRWLATATDDVVFEGERLCNGAFFRAVQAMPDRRLRIVMLDVDPDCRAVRRTERGTQQNERWLAGRETKYRNLIGDPAVAPYMSTHPNNCIGDKLAVVRTLQGFLRQEVMEPQA